LHQGVLGEETNSWGLDTIGEMAKAWAMTQKHTDLFCAHYYNFRAKGENEVMGAGGIPVPCVPGDLKRMATAAGYPLYLGEFGVLPGRGMKKADKFLVNNPDWFTSFTDDRQQAAKIIQPALQSVLEAHVNLTHWWNYGSERDQNDIAWKRNPDLVRLVIEANRKLQMENMGFTYMKELSAK
jgi:hypothetical protein